MKQSPEWQFACSEPRSSPGCVDWGSGRAAHGPLQLHRRQIFGNLQEFDYRAEVVARWRALIQHCHRVRRLQRIWGVLGGFLRCQVPASLRDRLLATWPQSVPPLALTNV